jgi:hypothetical protein
MTDEELDAASARIQQLREEVRDELAEDLGGDPDDYSAESYFRNWDDDTSEAVPDGGE